MTQTRPEPYAVHSGRKASDNVIGGDLHEAHSDLDYLVWVARRFDKPFVIDAENIVVRLGEPPRPLP